MCAVCMFAFIRCSVSQSAFDCFMRPRNIYSSFCHVWFGCYAKSTHRMLNALANKFPVVIAAVGMRTDWRILTHRQQIKKWNWCKGSETYKLRPKVCLCGETCSQECSIKMERRVNNNKSIAPKSTNNRNIYIERNEWKEKKTNLIQTVQRSVRINKIRYSAFGGRRIEYVYKQNPCALNTSNNMLFMYFPLGFVLKVFFCLLYFFLCCCCFLVSSEILTPMSGCVYSPLVRLCLALGSHSFHHVVVLGFVCFYSRAFMFWFIRYVAVKCSDDGYWLWKCIHETSTNPHCISKWYKQAMPLSSLPVKRVLFLSSSPSSSFLHKQCAMQRQ